MADAYLMIEGVVGESTDAKHKGQIDIDQFSWSAVNGADNSEAGGPRFSKVTIGNFHFKTKSSKATPKLFEFCCTGKVANKATLTQVTAAGTAGAVFCTWTFYDVVVSQYQTSATETDNRANDSFTIAFNKFEIEYKEQNQQGQVGAGVRSGWDVKKNVKY